ncbi:MAG TPA: hypothetical protein VMX17_07495 [Candidatus Glassbacteria bacterium]|nr:hypothetical protein [Candidatus Glassbacteria bacterium]
MANEKKKSTIEEAVNDLQKIREAADTVAMRKLVKEFPKKFEALLKEELNKVSNKESEHKEPVKGKKKESVKDSAGKVNESIMDITEMSLGEVEQEYDNTDGNTEFQVEPTCGIEGAEGGENEIELTMGDIEEELAKMEGLATNMDGGQPEVKEANNDAELKGDPFDQIRNIFNQLGKMVQEMDDQKMHEEYQGIFQEQMSQTYGEGYGTTLGEEKTKELYEMFVAHKKGEPYGDNSHAKPNVNEAEEDQPFEGKSDPSTEQGQSIAENEEVVDEMHNKVPRGATANPEKGHTTTSAGINEEDIDEKFDFQRDVVDKNKKKGGDDDTKIEDDDKEETEKEGDDVDEAMGISYSAGTITPGKLGDHDGTHGRFRNQNEAFTKRMSSLIEENKKVTKVSNEYKKTLAGAEKLVESYRNALEKYRNQLSEMAVFNTNLANVNNLFVNEELALTTEDKVKIINKFKTINSITESEKGYTEMLTEMKGAKKTMTENVEEKMNGSVGESASQKIDEAIERTAYTNEHVDKIKKVMNYVERGKRI